MTVSIKQSIPCIVKSRPEVSINGEWSGKEIILNLKGTAFKVRAVIADVMRCAILDQSIFGVCMVVRAHANAC